MHRGAITKFAATTYTKWFEGFKRSAKVYIRYDRNKWFGLEEDQSVSQSVHCTVCYEKESREIETQYNNNLNEP